MKRIVASSPLLGVDLFLPFLKTDKAGRPVASRYFDLLVNHPQKTEYLAPPQSILEAEEDMIVTAVHPRDLSAFTPIRVDLLETLAENQGLARRTPVGETATTAAWVDMDATIANRRKVVLSGMSREDSDKLTALLVEKAGEAIGAKAVVQRIRGLRLESVLTPKQAAWVNGAKTNPEEAKAQVDAWMNATPAEGEPRTFVVRLPNSDGVLIPQTYEDSGRYQLAQNHVVRGIDSPLELDNRGDDLMALTAEEIAANQEAEEVELQGSEVI